MQSDQNLHESLEDRTQVRLGSERSLGIVFALVFLIVGMWPLLSLRSPRVWALVAAAVFVVLAYLAPKALGPLNRLWFKIGMLLHRVVNPVVMALIFFLTVVPTGLVMRLLRRDPLRLRFDKGATTYWIRRDPPGPPGESLRNQF